MHSATARRDLCLLLQLPQDNDIFVWTYNLEFSFWKKKFYFLEYWYYLHNLELRLQLNSDNNYNTVRFIKKRPKLHFYLHTIASRRFAYNCSVSFCIAPCSIVLHRIDWYRVSSHHVTSKTIASHSISSYNITSYRVASHPYRTVPYFTMFYHTILHYII